VNTDGSKISAAEAVAPEKIMLVPDQGLRFAEDEHDFRKDLMSIAPGTTLYQVYAVEGDELRYLGYLQTTSPVRASEFSDKKLFFKHSRDEDGAQ